MTVGSTLIKVDGLFRSEAETSSTPSLGLEGPCGAYNVAYVSKEPFLHRQMFRLAKISGVLNPGRRLNGL